MSQKREVIMLRLLCEVGLAIGVLVLDGLALKGWLKIPRNEFPVW